ncbi:MAG TPA: DUF882 domain-containing protein [Thermopetrobacter sp.]|nr:DUF882 domain-containing protein [Thermopetrobacter sp.]
MTLTYFAHWRDVPEGFWRWKNFTPQEIACRGDGTLLVNAPALDRLQKLRETLGKPMIVHSAYRSPSYNRKVGGVPHSMHLQGAAFDVSMANHDPVDFETAARNAGFTGFGTYPRQNFMHIDTGRPRRWGDPFPHRAGRFAAEPPRLREKLADSRTMKGGGVAGASTVGTAGVEMAQQSLQDAQSSLQPLIPYLDTLRWAFITAALAGVALTIYARWDDWRRGRR